jgi:HlyD family secretion protein
VPSRLPKARHWSRRGKWLLALLGLLTVGGTGLAGWYLYSRKHAARPDLMLQAVKKEKLQITITDRGSLEPAENSYLSCKVKAKSPGQAATSIRWVIDNGTFVKKGDRIMELDDSALLDQLGDRQINLLNAEKAWKQAELDRDTNLLTNKADVETRKTAIEVAKITLEEYVKGQYAQSKIDLENKLTMAHSDWTMWKERAAWSDRMSRPGLQYVTVSQAEADEARRLSAELTRNSLSTQIKVLDTLTKKKNSVDFQGKIDEADRQVELAQKKLDKTLERDDVNVRTAYAVYQKEMGRLRDLEKEIDNCFIRAPRDGMVVYYVEERARFGASSAGVIAQGEQVKEGQKLLSIPDLRRMVVNARVHEAMVSRVKDDIMTETGFSEAVNTSLLLTPQPLSGLSAYAAFLFDMHSTFSSEHAQLEKRRDRRGMEAVVRVNAFPDRELKAHVKAVAPVASQTDFFSSDVKVYQTYIAIDDDRLDGLKPGMDAVVTIFVESKSEPVLAVPLQAVLGTVDMGEKRRCFVMVEGRPEMREIVLGTANVTDVEVKEGLEEGDVVVLNPAVLLSDKEKLEYGVSAQNNQGGQGGQKGRGGSDGRKGKGPGGPGMKGGPGMQGGPSSGPGMPGSPGGGQRGMRGGAGGGSPRGQGSPPAGANAPASP